MSRANPIIEDWQAKFQKAFEFHPGADEIMERILSDEPISIGQINRWWREADYYADMKKVNHG